MRLSDLLGLQVRTESGARLGRVHDVRGELSPGSLRLTALVIGKHGLAERLGLATLSARAALRERDAIAWEDVVRADRSGVVVRDRGVLAR